LIDQLIDWAIGWHNLISELMGLFSFKDA